MTSISQRDHDELIRALEEEYQEISASPEAARKFMVQAGFGNYCSTSGAEVDGGNNVVPCDCEFCDQERVRNYYAALQNSRLFRLIN